MKWLITLFIIWCMFFVCGCAVIFYGRVGHQKLGKVKLVVEKQEADPNLKGLIDLGLIKL